MSLVKLGMTQDLLNLEKKMNNTFFKDFLSGLVNLKHLEGAQSVSQGSEKSFYLDTDEWFTSA